MNTTKITSIVLAGSLLLFAGCKPEIDEFTPEAGSADFTTYVAVGNSLTAGYANNDLYASGQKESFPAFLATQLALAGGGEFTQPMMVSENGLAAARLVLGPSTDCLGATSLGPVIFSDVLNTSNFASIWNGEPFNNMGVPGAQIGHLLFPGYGHPQLGNPYYARFASSPGVSTIMEDAMLNNPTFFTLWAGNNDVLSFATSGGVNPITDQAGFDGALGAVVQTLTSGGAKGVLANIPDVTSIPFFTTVPYNALVLTAEQAAGLNGAFAQLPDINFVEGPNAMLTVDSTAAGGMRHLVAGELVLLSIDQDGIKCEGLGSLNLTTDPPSPNPIPGQFILDAGELADVKAATANFNASILAQANTAGLGHADMNATMAELTTGLVFDGITVSATYVTGGAFSLDGVHPNSRGYAIITNEFIDVINEKYGASIPKVDITEVTAIAFP